MALRAYPINSSVDAEVTPGVNDYDTTRLETGILTKGIVEGFAVTERGAGANLSIDIAPGIALIEITNTNVSHGKTYKTWFESTAIENKAITAADLTNPRKDRVVLRIDVSIDPNAASSNIAIIEVLAGTPAGSPTAPAEPANAITLAIVDIPASDTTITNSQITLGAQADLQDGVLANAARVSDLASDDNGKGASMISIEDPGGKYTATDLEAALLEIAKELASYTRYVTVSDSNNITSGTSDTDFNTTHTVDASEDESKWEQGVEYRVQAWGVVDGGLNNRQLRLKLKLGSTALITFDAVQPSTNGVLRGWYADCSVVCRTTGPTGTVQCSGVLTVETSASGVLSSHKVADSTVTIDTTADGILKFAHSWNADDGTKHCKIKNMKITRSKVRT